ncbi:uncharacterized protein LOC119148516 isoform X2 [Falco rusticolus]|uniref:uncharacterized protein LOC119148516 isoform X2 n=2 Tax=Falco TaxID=8952 RepID=UPI0018869131|nr:uncharacterized protein LOC119148516 isoform X2 [Falco rusticolus]
MRGPCHGPAAPHDTRRCPPPRQQEPGTMVASGRQHPGGSRHPPTRDRGDLRVTRGGDPGARPVAPRGTGGDRGSARRRRRRSHKQTVQQKLRESFPIPRLLVNRLTTFLIELVRFLGETLVQVLVVGLLTAIGDHIWKPFLAAVFNSLLQPLLVFLLKVLCSIQDLMDPLINILAGVCSQLAVLLRAIRLVEINLQLDRTGLRADGSG